jgi:hypothetical protein
MPTLEASQHKLIAAKCGQIGAKYVNSPRVRCASETVSTVACANQPKFATSWTLRASVADVRAAQVRYAMRKRKIIVKVILGTVLFGCGERSEDFSTVYVVPINCDCDMAFDCGAVCPKGDYPINTPFEVIYEINTPPSEISSEKCSIEQTGEFELTVHTSWLGHDRSDVGGNSYFDCDDRTPPLASGTWTIRHGSSSATLEIPSAQVDTVCVWGWDQSGANCTEVLWE